jgi:hypothetical protein
MAYVRIDHGAMPDLETLEMNAETASDDLAFLRAIVEPSDTWQRSFGEIYSAAGVCYGVQMLLHGGQLLGLAPANGPIALAIGLGPSVVFVVALIILVSRHRGMPGGGATSRAIGAVFGAVGLTNLVLIAAIGSIAWRRQSVETWLIYPCVVMILQGMAWLVAYMMRRRGWMAGVAAGWFATGVSMAVFIDNYTGFVISAGVGMVAFMLLPGLFILRQAGRSA